MPRLKKEGLAYFPFDVNFFSDDKIENLRWAYGPVGILTYINLLARMYTHRYYIEFNDIADLSRSIAKDIACDQLRKTATRVTEIINYLVGSGILDKGLYEQGVVSGQAMQEQYIVAAHKMRRKEIRLDVYALVDVFEVLRKNKINVAENTIIVTLKGVYVALGTQSKSKVKLLYNNNNIYTTTYNNYSYIFYNNAREREEAEKGLNVENSVETPRENEIPTLDEVAEFFLEETSLRGDIRCSDEAQKFIDYNYLLKWKCLPDWKAAARRWVEKGTI